ncbi:MAG: ferritin-like protein [Nitrospirales bacterium]
MKIETRDHLLSTLAEASELEHNLMCLYLYAAFSLKQSTAEGITPAELEAITTWRTEILAIAGQEMTHLALVTNLTTAVGGSAHLFRPGFPAKAGYYPSDFVIELAPFSLATLDHFIFLERPEDREVQEGQDFQPAHNYTRDAPQGRLMDYAGEYETVGQLYQLIEEGIEGLSETMGEKDLFCGARSLQIAPPELELEGLILIHDKASALTAINTIVSQGEGARTQANSHFEKFTRIKESVEKLMEKNHVFEAGRPGARNPVMRKPVESEGTIWIDDARAVLYLDLGNAIYSLMLRFLLQLYSMENRTAEARKVLLEGALPLMHGIGAIAAILSQLPASPEVSGVNAGLSFDLIRHFNPIELSSENQLLTERLNQLLAALTALRDDGQFPSHADSLERVQSTIVHVRDSLQVTDLAQDQ